jgi:hypothetical protein
VTCSSEGAEKIVVLGGGQPSGCALFVSDLVYEWAIGQVRIRCGGSSVTDVLEARGEVVGVGVQGRGNSRDNHRSAAKQRIVIVCDHEPGPGATGIAFLEHLSRAIVIKSGGASIPKNGFGLAEAIVRVGLGRSAVAEINRTCFELEGR